MKKMDFCTVIDSNFIDYIKTQYHFLTKFNKNVRIYVLVCTTNLSEIQTPPFESLPEAIKCFTLLDVCREGIGKEIFDKYFQAHIHEFRWAMKSVFLNFLYEKGFAEKIIFTDWDIIFFEDYGFLFDELDKHDILLTPHWTPLSPLDVNDPVDQKGFLQVFTNGIYNAGFIGTNKNSRKLLEWLSKVCLYICEIDPSRGLFADQTHLNLLPLISEQVGVVRHRGCNVAQWNKIECRRVKVGDKTLINGQYPIVFIHFTSYTVEHILDGGDELLRPYLDDYAAAYVEITGRKLPVLVNYENRQKLKNKKDTAWETVKKKALLYQNKVRIITRVRRFLEG